MDMKCTECKLLFTRNCKITIMFYGHPFHTDFSMKLLKTHNRCPHCKNTCLDFQLIEIHFSRPKKAIIGFQNSVDVVHSATDLHWLALYGQTNLYLFTCMNSCENKSPRTVDGSTPLHYAASNGHLEMCRIILDLKDDMIDEKNPKNVDGNTPLHFAAKVGCSKTLQILMNEVEEKNPKNNDGFTPLHLAAEKGNLEMVKLIMNQVPNVIEKMFYGNEPKAINFVVDSGHIEILNMIICHVESQKIV